METSNLVLWNNINGQERWTGVVWIPADSSFHIFITPEFESGAGEFLGAVIDLDCYIIF
jgi:hypothetical protein